MVVKWPFRPVANFAQQPLFVDLKHISNFYMTDDVKDIFWIVDKMIKHPSKIEKGNSMYINVCQFDDCGFHKGLKIWKLGQLGRVSPKFGSGLAALISTSWQIKFAKLRSNRYPLIYMQATRAFREIANVTRFQSILLIFKLN